MTVEVVFTIRAFALLEPRELSQFDLRVDPAEAERLPFEIPTEPNTVASRRNLDVLWLGPDEWLAVGDREAPPQPDLTGVHHSWIDVGANRVVFELAGSRTMDVLASGCGLDLHPRAWREGMCAQTLLAKAPVILQHTGVAQRVFVRPSYRDYLVAWIEDAVTA